MCVMWGGGREGFSTWLSGTTGAAGTVEGTTPSAGLQVMGEDKG